MIPFRYAGGRGPFKGSLVKDYNASGQLDAAAFRVEGIMAILDVVEGAGIGPLDPGKCATGPIARTEPVLVQHPQRGVRGLVTGHDISEVEAS